MFGVSDNKLSETKQDEHATTAATKIASTFNTNRTYINEAAKIRENKPELFEQIKSGEKTITEAVRESKRKEVIDKLENIESIEAKAIEVYMML
jgi:hypothetical protein